MTEAVNKDMLREESKLAIKLHGGEIYDVFFTMKIYKLSIMLDWYESN